MFPHYKVFSRVRIKSRRVKVKKGIMNGLLNLGLSSEQTNRKVFKAVASYMGYFGSRFVGNDIQVLCGNLLDHPIAKTFTLFCIMFQATDNLNLAIFMTVVFLILQYFMSITPACNRYIDKTAAKNINIHAVTWPKNKDLDNLELKPGYNPGLGDKRKRGAQMD